MNKLNDRHTLLIFPPFFYPHMPYLALPALSGVLKRNGEPHSILDLNVLLYNHLLDPGTISKALKTNQQNQSDPNCLSDLKEKLELTAHESMDSVQHLILEALKKIKGKSNSLDKDINPWDIITLSLDIVSDSHFPEEVTLTSYDPGVNLDSSKAILSLIPTKEKLIFYEFCMNSLKKQINSNNTNTLAFSITCPEQLIPTICLSAGIRELFPKIKIIWGGSIVTRLNEIIINNGSMSQYFDYLLLGEGDNKILETLHEINKLEINIDNKQKNNLDSLPTPNFDDLPLNLYFDKYPIIPILASRKCYWGKCLFCDIHSSYDSKHRIRSSALVVNDIEFLSKKYSTKFFKFTDDAVSPTQLKNIAEELNKRNLDIKWEAYVRMEEEFSDPQFCKLLESSGCSWLYFGFESGNQETLKNMNKGNNINLNSKIVKAVSQAGIKVHLWVIIGFPGDTEKDIWNSVDFLLEHKKHISSLEINSFALSKLAPINKMSFIEKFAISPFVDKESDLALIYNYHTNALLTQKTIIKLTKKIREFLEQNMEIQNVVRSSHLCFHDKKNYKEKGIHYAKAL